MTTSDYVVVDVETSGTDPNTDRVLSIAALTMNPDGTIDRTLHTLLNPGVDPGPTNIHGLTPAKLAGQPQYPTIAPALAELLNGRILVAHNVAFDYAFLAAEARRSGTELPVTTALCTVELARNLNLGTGSLSLAALAHHWDITQTKPHDALDDARVLAAILSRALTAAARRNIALPLRAPHTLTTPVFTPSHHCAA